HIDYGKYEDSIISVFFYYVSYFIIFYFPFWVIIILFYNWIVIEKLKAFPNLHLIRIVFGLITGFIIGLICQHAQGTFYIGKFRPLRNIILFTLVGLSTEVVRVCVNHYFFKKKSI
ncbi:MAG TPA: hypothetical protein PLG88_05060, partial [Chitinophagaceae bacterium]|nr:hypothetical protein [Chitinophagaceae bacterium]